MSVVRRLPVLSPVAETTAYAAPAEGWPREEPASGVYPRAKRLEAELPAGEAPPLSRDQRRSRRKRAVKARTLSLRHLTARELERGRTEAWVIAQNHFGGRLPQRPTTREACCAAPGPCPFTSCRWHLKLDVSPYNGSIKDNFPDADVDEMVETCALREADRGGSTLERVAEVMNLTRERVRQIEVRALEKLVAAGLTNVRELAEGLVEMRDRRVNQYVSRGSKNARRRGGFA